MLNPKERPNGDQHHTEIPATQHDVEVGFALAYVIGGLFVDKASNPERPHSESYFYREMTSADAWTRVVRALRFHGLTIVPEVPTERMLRAAFDDYIAREKSKMPWNARTMWDAMLQVVKGRA